MSVMCTMAIYTIFGKYSIFETCVGTPLNPISKHFWNFIPKNGNASSKNVYARSKNEYGKLPSRLNSDPWVRFF